MKLAESYNSSYEKLWKNLLNERNDYQFSQEDQEKVASQLDGNMD